MAHRPILHSTGEEIDPALLHPMNSSRLMLNLLDLVELGRSRSQGLSDLSGLISLPVLKRLLSALQYRNPMTMAHSRRTSNISVGIAERLGWESDSLRVIEVAALLHDFGKVGIPDHILLKPSRLSPDESACVLDHQRVALSVLQACNVRPDVIEIVAQSHGLAGRFESLTGQLSLGARILAVADAYDSLTSRQSYREAYDPLQAMRILEQQSGKQFDRNVVAALSRWLSSPEAAILQQQEFPTSASLPLSDFQALHDAFEMCHLLTSLNTLDQLYEAYFLIDDELRICIWSSGAEHVFNRTASDVIGTPWDPTQFSIVAVASSDGAYSLQSTLRDGKPMCRPLSVKDQDEQLHQLEIHTIPLCEENETRGVLGLIYDLKQSRQHQGQFRQLQLAATRDALTGVFNRGELERQLKELFEEYQESPSDRVFSVMFLDLDHFKSINDRLGHDVGDRVLIDVARLIEDETYSGEIVGRYGGEEFVMVCPETDYDAALERAERLRRVLMQTQFAGRSDLRVTASLGVAQIEPGDTIETLLKRADEALYAAKDGGRNRTCGLHRAAPTTVTSKQQQQSDWVVTTELVSTVAVELLALKLRGFLEDHEARLIRHSESQFVLECGSAGLFGWGNQPNRQPVRLTIDVEQAAGRGKQTKRLLMHLKIEPVSRPLRAETFQRRARQVIDLVRSYCIADVLSAQNC